MLFDLIAAVLIGAGFSAGAFLLWLRSVDKALKSSECVADEIITALTVALADKAVEK